MKWTTQGVKPRIRKMKGGWWICSGAGRSESGPSPSFAYWLWKAAEPRVTFPQHPQWIAPHHPPLDYFNRNWMEVMA